VIERDFTYKWRFPWHFYRKDVISWQFKLQKMVDLWRLNQQKPLIRHDGNEFMVILMILGGFSKKKGNSHGIYPLDFSGKLT
jgi:hypothetical protein